MKISMHRRVNPTHNFVRWLRPQPVLDAFKRRRWRAGKGGGVRELEVLRGVSSPGDLGLLFCTMKSSAVATFHGPPVVIRHREGFSWKFCDGFTVLVIKRRVVGVTDEEGGAAGTLGNYHDKVVEKKGCSECYC